MKKIFTYSTVLCCLLLLAQSCTKQLPDAREQAEQVINATVAAGQTYTFTPPSSGLLSVSRQAAHFGVSEVGIGKDNSTSIYQYTAAAGYKGTDEVSLNFISTIPASENTGGCRGSNSGTYTTVNNTIVIKLNVTD